MPVYKNLRNSRKQKLETTGSRTYIINTVRPHAVKSQKASKDKVELGAHALVEQSAPTRALGVVWKKAAGALFAQEFRGKRGCRSEVLSASRCDKKKVHGVWFESSHKESNSMTVCSELYCRRIALLKALTVLYQFIAPMLAGRRSSSSSSHQRRRQLSPRAH